MRRWALFSLLLVTWGHSAYALEMIKQDKLYFYFPKGQENLSFDLLSAYSAMSAFLEDHQIPVALPLHIVLDENLDNPQIRLTIVPHREIRIPLKAPGVLEDGYTEPNPYRYFLFKGLCAQGIYNKRSGIPKVLHKVFGEIASPNAIIPDWAIDGVSFLLYEEFIQRRVQRPMADLIFNAGPIPNLDKVSNHPDIWPGRVAYQIYGRPFIRWLYERYGWKKLLAVFQRHGSDYFPLEIDSEARHVYNMSWSGLWRAFQREYTVTSKSNEGLLISGYWADPFVYWNDMGVYPGLAREKFRGRYGFLDDTGWLWLSEYGIDGTSRITAQYGDTVRFYDRKHVWDPGPGFVAVIRQGREPFLLVIDPSDVLEIKKVNRETRRKESIIPAPTGAIQMSGPVRDGNGRIAVSVNINGNWDIWVYDRTWHRITSDGSVEMDPWFVDDHLVFTSNISGRFQIHTVGMDQLTYFETAGTLPRDSRCLQLKDNGWQPVILPPTDLPSVSAVEPDRVYPVGPEGTTPKRKIASYSPLYSLWPNYLVPDIFIDTERTQLGVSTKGKDVSGKFTFGSGVRYSFDDDIFSWRLDGRISELIFRMNRYPFSYTTHRDISLSELRHELKLGWVPPWINDMEISANGRRYVPDKDDRLTEYEYWASLDYRKQYGNYLTRITIDLFAEGSQSIYGEVLYRFGERINTNLHLQMGKTWGDLIPGHNSFRIGGNTGEGYFTYRPNRLFPLPGFDANILDADQAVVTSIEVTYPLAHLQTGYKTLPLFLRNLDLGIFANAGTANKQLNGDEILFSAGFEFVTGLELAWAFASNFRMGIAWPLSYPDDLNPKGPVWLIQIGKPL